MVSSFVNREELSPDQIRRRWFLKNFDGKHVDREELTPDQARPRWFIDLDWYQVNNRSFFTLARSYLCPKCRQQLKVEEGEIAAADLVAAIKDCCSKEPGFIAGELPILESTFRLFLASGNHPLDLPELGEQLSERRGGDTYRTSVEILSRLLESDQFYGLSQVAG